MIRRPLFAVRAALLLAAPLALVPFILWETCALHTCPDVGSLRFYQPAGAPVLVDRHGEVFADLAPPDRTLVKLDTLPKHLPEAFLAIEDQRFYEHGTVDWRRFVGAAMANLKSGGVRQGFSTISMQLARSVFPDRLPVERRTFRRKLLEIRVAREIEQTFTKKEILELYLNHVYMGRGMYGVENAARQYFGVSARKLTLSQSAMLAAMVKSPARFDPVRHPKIARERRNLALARMQQQQLVTAAAAESASKAPLATATRPTDPRTSAGLAPYVVEHARHLLHGKFGHQLSDAPARIRTSIDSAVQRAAEEELRAQLRAIEQGAAGTFKGPGYDPMKRRKEKQTDYLDGAVVVMDAQQGDVLAWVGGRDFSRSRFDHVTGARRQAGSAFKPFVYAAAVDKGFFLSQPVDDAPVTVQLTKKRKWTPRNASGHHDGVVSIRDALVHSTNTATVRLAQEVGLEQIAATARNAGLEVTDTQPSLALGAVEVTPLELTAAYTVFANNGVLVAPRLVLEAEDSDGTSIWKAAVERARRMDDSTAFLVTDVLADAVRRGTGKAAMPKRTKVPAAGKTGTTNDVTDAWFIGYTPDLIIGIWIGFDRPRPIVGESTAARLAAPMWGRLVDRIYADRAIPLDWSVPADVYRYTTDVASGLPLAEGCRGASTSDELFAADRVPAAYCPGRDSLPNAVLVASAPRQEAELRQRAIEATATVVQSLPPPASTTARPPASTSPRSLPPPDSTTARALPPSDSTTARSLPPADSTTARPLPSSDSTTARATPPASLPPARVQPYASRRQEQPDVVARARPARPMPDVDAGPAARARADDFAPEPVRDDDASVRVSTSPPPWAYETRSRDLSGWWNLTTEIRATAVPAYQNLRLGYRIQLEQYGDRIVGRGQKWSENGRTIGGAGRTPIELTGSVRDGRVVLAFRERGSRRTSGGAFSFSVSPDWHGLGGTFRSDAASTSGSAIATRLH